jgi:hypothetical protein
VKTPPTGTPTSANDAWSDEPLKGRAEPSGDERRKVAERALDASRPDRRGIAVVDEAAEVARPDHLEV